MAEIDKDKPPLTGTELRMQIQSIGNEMRMRQKTEQIAEVLARFPCRADDPELDRLRRIEAAYAVVAHIEGMPISPDRNR